MDECKPLVTNGGNKVNNFGMDLKISKKAVAPFLDNMSRKLRQSQTPPPGRFALHTLMKSHVIVCLSRRAYNETGMRGDASK